MKHSLQYLQLRPCTAAKYVIDFVFTLAVPKITGGNIANPADFPYQVSLQNKARQHFCGATIIHPFLLLSAAHCFQREGNQAPKIQSVAGEHDLTANEGNEQVREVVHVFTHLKFNTTMWDHDIAVLVLNESLKLNDYVRAEAVREPTWELPGMTVIMNNFRI